MASGSGQPQIPDTHPKQLTEGPLLDLKMRKTRLKTAFTKTKNRLIAHCNFEGTVNKKEVKILQHKLDCVLDEVMEGLTELYEYYKSVGDFEQADRVTEEIEKIDRDYAEAHLEVKEALETMKSTESMTEPNLEKDLWKQMRRVGIPVFNGDKRKYESWIAAFTACVDKAPATPEYKLLQLRQYVEGDALKAIEDLGHSAEAYEAAKSRLERKFGGERRKVLRFLDDLDKFMPLKNEDAGSLERFADLLDIVVLNLKEAGSDDLGNGSLYYSLQKKMPETLLSRFHRWLYETNETESVETLRNWVVQESSYLTIASETKYGFSQSSSNKSNKKSANNSFFNENDDKKKIDSNCKICQDNHQIWDCSRFKDLTVTSRWQKAKELGLCFRCLKDNHKGNKCKNFRKCSIEGCTKTHNRLLHSKTVPLIHENQNSYYISKSKIALRTVPVILKSKGKSIKVNALLDDGSTKTYISQDIASALELKGETECVKVNVLSGKTESFESMAVKLGLESFNSQLKMSIDASVINSVTGPLNTIDWNRQGQKWEHLRGINFPSINRNDKIDILIGLDYAQLHASLHEIHGQPGEPIARLTPLGWTCVGKINDEIQTSLFSTYFVQEQNEMNEIMKGFWNVDSCGSHKQNEEILSLEEKSVLVNTEESINFKDGHYEVSIPWKEEPNMTNNFEMAKKRLDHTMKRLSKEPQVATIYRDTMNKYIEKGYIREVSQSEPQPESKWYLPHFPVVHMNRQTTKVRIVFDAAAKYQGSSLNDYIHQGPKLQNELFDVLLRFRKHDIAVVCDISEMYLQVGIIETDRRFHRLLWDNSEFEFNRLVFGVNASPFLAQYVSQYNARKYENIYPTAAETVLQSTYMDDSMDSVCSEEEGIELYSQLSELWKKAGMCAKKWLSNSVNVLARVPSEDRAMEVDLDCGYLPTTKALGVTWEAKMDMLTFRLNKDINSWQKITKRNLLKSVASIFDPLGFISPFVIGGKILMQKMWVEHYDWDDEVDEQFALDIQHWLNDIEKLNEVGIQRSLSFKKSGLVEFHVFVDASQEGYGAVIYSRQELEKGEFDIRFVCSKTRVAPLNATSIPRLELMAAILGLRLAISVTDALKRSINEVTFWSDSTNVLWWISRPSRVYKPFVANRVGEIHEFTSSSQWRYVPTDKNPADLASRGVTAYYLLSSDLWWRGPDFLYSCCDRWPENKITSGQNECVNQEIKKSSVKSCVYTSVLQESSEFKLNPTNFSSWLRLVRVHAWMNRFISNCRSKIDKCLESELSVDEIRESEYFFIREAQKEHFIEEYSCLSKGRSFSHNSKLLSLNAKIDENGIIRCDTRLKYAEFLPYNTRFPIVLPRKSRVTKLLVKYYHEQNDHSGTNQTLASLSSSYWLISGREEIREWENECSHCKKLKSRPGMQIMAPLPKARTEKSMRAFAYCSVDFGGPFLTKQGRGKARQKRYLCLFTCMASRAVHLEIAFGLDTDSFLNAFYRMVSRRGFPDEMYSDNGTNFVGAYKELKDLLCVMDRDKIQRSSSKNGVKWFFNPPLAPHFGGIHEAMIKTAKRALYKVLNSADMTDEELLTAFIGAEGLINSRPIAYQTSNPADDCVITPNHFLHGQIGGKSAPESVDTTVFNIKKRWRHVQEIVKHFWQRWLREFIPTLSGRKKWYKVERDFKVGDVVLVVDQDKPRGQWSLGKIVDIFPGNDGHVRVVNVLVGKTIFRRPITKLCLIEKSE